MILQLAFVLTAIIIGARLGGIGLGVMGGVGLGILTFVFGLQPTAPPIDVMLMIAAVISAASCMLSLNDNQLAIAGENFVYNASLLDAEVRLMEKYKSEELAKYYSTQLDQLYNEYVTRMKGK